MRNFFKIIFLFFCLLLGLAELANAWWNTNWGKRRALVLKNSFITANQDSFTVSGQALGPADRLPKHAEQRF